MGKPKLFIFAYVLLLHICQAAGAMVLNQPATGDSLAAVSGRTFEQHGDKMLAAPDVFVKLISGADTLAAQASAEGAFRFEGITPGKKTIVASGIKYHPTLVEVELFSGSNAVMVEMRPKYLDIIPAYVTAKVAPVTQRGDTLIYHPAAVKTLDGENAIEILRQMPGVDIKGNDIFISGQKVERAYVNGLLLFGDDPMAPLNAILAQNVRQIRSYEEASVETRIKNDRHGKKDRVIDISTKEPIVNAFDGYAQAAGGVDEAPKENGRPQGRYFAGLNANFFSERFLAYVNTYSNNIGRENNIQTDGLSNGGSLQDYHQKTYAAVGVQKFWGDRLLGSNFKLSYAYGKDRRRDFVRSLMTYPGTDGNPQRAIEDTSQSNLSSGVHQICVYSEINDKKLKNWLIDAEWLVDQSVSEKYRSQWNRVSDGDIYTLHEKLDGRKSSVSGRNSITWQDMYSGARITPLAILHFNVNPSKGEDWIIDTLASSINRRYLSTTADARNTDVSISVGARIKLWNKESSTSDLNAFFSAEYINRHSRQIAFDLYDSSGPLPTPEVNITNTFDFYKNYLALGPSLLYKVSGRDWNTDVSFSPRFTTQYDRELLPYETGGQRDFFLPSGELYFHYKTFGVRYSLMSQIPAVEQYRDRLDDRNPLFLVQGNPELGRSVSHSVTLNYDLPMPKRAAQLGFTIEGKAVTDAIVCKTQYFDKAATLDKYAYTVQPGASLSSFENSNGTWNIGASGRFNKRVQAIGANLTASIGVNYGQKPYFRDIDKIYVKEFVPYINASALIRPNRKLILRANYYLNYFDSKNNLGQVLTRGITSGALASGQYNFGKRFFASANYAVDCTKLSQVERLIQFHRLRASVGMNMLKGRMKISVSGNDLLNRGSSYTIAPANDHTLETWTPSYGRYYLVHISFRLNKMKPATAFEGQLSRGEGIVQ